MTDEQQALIHPAAGGRLSTNDYRHIAACPDCQAAFGGDVAAMAQDVAGAGRDVQQPYVTPGHPTAAGAGYDCGCGQCLEHRRAAIA